MRKHILPAFLAITWPLYPGLVFAVFIWLMTG